MKPYRSWTNLEQHSVCLLTCQVPWKTLQDQTTILLANAWKGIKERTIGSIEPLFDILRVWAEMGLFRSYGITYINCIIMSFHAKKTNNNLFDRWRLTAFSLTFFFFFFFSILISFVTCLKWNHTGTELIWSNSLYACLPVMFRGEIFRIKQSSRWRTLEKVSKKELDYRFNGTTVQGLTVRNVV